MLYKLELMFNNEDNLCLIASDFNLGENYLVPDENNRRQFRRCGFQQDADKTHEILHRGS